MKEQKLKRITDGDRRRMLLAASQNRRSRKWQEAKLDSQFGPHTCGHCRSEPCGAMWPHSACCHRCTHLPMPRWRLTHVLWYRKKPYYVMEVAARRPGAEGSSRTRGLGLGAWGGEPGSDRARIERPSDSRSGSGGKRRSGRTKSSLVPVDAPSPKPQAGERSEPPLSAEQLFGVQTSSGGNAAATDAIYYRWDGVAQWVRRARTHYFLGVRVSPAEFLRSLPNEEELLEFAPRERPPHPFEEGISEASDGEEGAPFLDRQQIEPEDGEVLTPHGKQGLRFVDLDEVSERDEDDGEEA